MTSNTVFVVYLFNLIMCVQVQGLYIGQTDYNRRILSFNFLISVPVC